MRIDEQRLLHLPRGPGEGGEDEHAGILRVLRRHIFLGDEVHPVPQRGHEADARCPVHPGKIDAGIPLVHIADRHPFDAGEFAIDMARQRIELGAYLLIAAHILPRGRRDLEQEDLFLHVRIGGKKTLIPEETILQSLGIIEPVDAQYHRPAIGARQHPATGGERFLPARHLHEGGGIDADRAGDRLQHPSLIMERAVLAYFRIQLVLRIMKEGIEPVLRLETHHVVREERFDQFAMMGQRQQQPGRRPGDMEEKPEPVGDALAPQFPPQRDQMIVMHPDEIVVLQQRQQGLGEAAVRALIAALEFPRKFGEVDPVMEQRPERAVRIAVIIFVDILRLQIDRRGGDAFGPLKIDMAAEILRLPARPAEPDAAALAQRGGKGDRQPALIARAFARRRLHPVGHDDQAAVHRTVLHGWLSRTAQLIVPTSE